MKLFSVPVTIRASIDVAAADINEAMREARCYAEACGDNGHFRDGWNDIQRENKGAEIVNASSFDTEPVETVEVTYCGERWLIVPQRDLHAGTDDAVHGTRFEQCADADATVWAVWQRMDEDTSDLVEDYPSRAQAEAAIAALVAREPVPTPIWPGFYVIGGSVAQRRDDRDDTIAGPFTTYDEAEKRAETHRRPGYWAAVDQRGDAAEMEG